MCRRNDCGVAERGGSQSSKDAMVFKNAVRLLRKDHLTCAATYQYDRYMINGNRRQGTVVRFRLRPEKAQEIIRETAKDTANVILARHMLERIEERDISDIEVY